MSGRLSEKLALITGAGSGLGLATARRFAAEGARIVMADLNEQAVREAAAAIGSAAHPMALDVGDPHSVAEVFARIGKEFGPIGAVVNFAGITRAEPIASMSLDSWNAVLRVNLTGSFLVAQAAAQAMKPLGRGSIVLVSSRLYLGGSGNASYVTSKGGVVSLARSFAMALERDNIRVNALAPGRTHTPMSRGNDFLRPVQQASQTRVAQPEEIAAVAVFLAGDDSAFVTGQAVLVDGGRTLGTAPA